MNERYVSKRERGLRTAVFFVVASALFVAGANMALAFGGHWGERDMERQMQVMAEKLNLNDSQKSRFRQIHEEYRGEGQALHEAMRKNHQALHSLDPAAKDYSKRVAELASEKAELSRQMVLHRSEVRAKTYAMLTPEQRQQMKQLRAERKGKRFSDGAKGKRDGSCRE